MGVRGRRLDVGSLWSLELSSSIFHSDGGLCWEPNRCLHVESVEYILSFEGACDIFVRF
jgi:hypothetical protein